MFRIEKLYRLTIRDHIAFKTPLMTKNFCQKMIATRNRFTIIIIIRTHYPQCSRFTKSFTERFQIKCSHLTWRYVWICTSTSITPTHRDTIYCKMFRSGNKPLCLKSFNHPLSKFPYKKRILPVTFHHTSPTRVLSDIQNWRINISISQCFRFFCCYTRNFAYQFFIPRSTLSALCRKHGCPIMTKSTNTFISKINRYSKTCFFYKPALDCLSIFYTIHIRVR